MEKQTIACLRDQVGNFLNGSSGSWDFLQETLKPLKREGAGISWFLPLLLALLITMVIDGAGGEGMHPFSVWLIPVFLVIFAICSYLGTLMRRANHEDFSKSRELNLKLSETLEFIQFAKQRETYIEALHFGDLSPGERYQQRRLLELLWIGCHWRLGLLHDPRPYMRELREVSGESLTLLRDIAQAEEELEICFAKAEVVAPEPLPVVRQGA